MRGRAAYRECRAERRVNRLLFVVNELSFFLSHRLEIAREARRRGYEVHVATPKSGRAKEIQQQNIVFHPIPLSRSGANIFKEAQSIVSLYKLFRKIRPDIVHTVTIKPVIYGGIAARFARVPALVSAISGLGYLYSAAEFNAVALRKFTELAYRMALRHPRSLVIFQNPDDQAFMIDRKLVTQDRATLIRGSGVDPARFAFSTEPAGAPVVLLAARMLWHKGVREFVEAAEILKGRGSDARFVLAGGVDAGNPAAIPGRQLGEWQQSGIVEWWGHQSDMSGIMDQCNIVCLPTYAEGLPKVLIEAAAKGRAIVATDVPGCREVVRPEVNGLLVPPKDKVALANALEYLIGNAGVRSRMAIAGRAMVENEFTEKIVVESTLALYEKLLADHSIRSACLEEKSSG